MNQREVAVALSTKFPQATVTLDHDHVCPAISAALHGEHCTWSAPHHKHWDWVLRAATGWLDVRANRIAEPADASTSGAP